MDATREKSACVASQSSSRQFSAEANASLQVAGDARMSSLPFFWDTVYVLVA